MLTHPRNERALHTGVEDHHRRARPRAVLSGVRVIPPPALWMVIAASASELRVPAARTSLSQPTQGYTTRGYTTRPICGAATVAAAPHMPPPARPAGAGRAPRALGHAGSGPSAGRPIRGLSLREPGGHMGSGWPAGWPAAC